MHIHKEQHEPLMKKIHLLHKDVRALVENFRTYGDIVIPDLKKELKDTKEEISGVEKSFKIYEKEAVKKLEQALLGFLEEMEKEP